MSVKVIRYIDDEDFNKLELDYKGSIKLYND